MNFEHGYGYKGFKFLEREDILEEERIISDEVLKDKIEFDLKLTIEENKKAEIKQFIKEKIKKQLEGGLSNE